VDGESSDEVGQALPEISKAIDVIKPLFFLFITLELTRQKTSAFWSGAVICYMFLHFTF
jgi:hypothetical protein